MKWPKFNFSLPKFLKIKSGELKKASFHRIWKKFVHQIPREFRTVAKHHQHFIVLGDEKAGKTELIRGIVEQSQNIFPFEVEYTSDLDIQYYLGPKQVVQELSIGVVKDRTITTRKNLIHLWKRLYHKKSPVIIIAYHCCTSLSDDKREVSKAASMIAGKLSLLSEIAKDRLNIRIALTHLDKIEGYLEFAAFLKQHNIVFEIPLASNFECQVLENSLARFRDQYLSLILTTVSADDFQKILKVFEELPKYFRGLEEYLRALMAGNISGELVLEKLTFSTKIEPYTSFPSFDWTAPESDSIFYRHPLLKHQIAAAAVFLTCTGLILNNYFKDRLQVKLTEQGVDYLLYLQPKVFVDEVIPKIEDLINNRPKEAYLPILPRFFKSHLRDANQLLAMRIRKRIFEPTLRKIMLQENSEIKILYMLGLIYSTQKNRLGEDVLKHIQDWSLNLDLDEKIIRSYIGSNIDNSQSKIEIEYLDKINTVLPLTSPAPWIDFLGRFQDIVDQPVFTGLNFDSLRQEASHLLNEYRKVKNDPHAFAICSALKQVEGRMHHDLARNKLILDWLEENGDPVEDFLMTVCRTCPVIPDTSDHNISQFFAKVKDITDLKEREYKPYNFEIRGEKFSINTAKWVSLSVAHVVERLINNYIVAFNVSSGDIFFKNTQEIPELVIESYRNEFPHFDYPVVIKGRYTRLAFEKNVRNTAESLLKLIEDLPLNLEDKERFSRFIQQQVVSYAIQYQQEYEKLYAACNIKSATLEELKIILKKITESASSFRNFLIKMKDQTEIFEKSSDALRMLDEKNHFAFLIRFLDGGSNQDSPFEKYQTLIKQISRYLEQHTDVKSYASVTNLVDVLSPAATITLSILNNDADSYLNQITEMLNENEVPVEYHYLFTAPVMQIYRLGIKDLRRGIDKVWAESLAPQINNLFSKRPFNDESTLLSSYEEVRKVTSPTGEVWSVIKQIVTPLSNSMEGEWSPKPQGDLQLDGAFYQAVNRLAKISNILWDNEGNPQPLRLNIQSLPFESVSKTEPQPILSYLVTGDETFHNFNQNPDWHLINIEWWKENSSTVVLELSNKGDSRSYREEKVMNTPWSFFELLKKAKSKQDNIWEWSLGNLQSPQVSHVALKFEQDPWHLFQTEKSY